MSQRPSEIYLSLKTALEQVSRGETWIEEKRMRMQTQDFIDLAKYITESELYDSNPDIQGAHDVVVVWFCKTLQNMKALLCVPSVQDGKYYEVTYNGDKDELYFDVYKKQMNMKFDSGDIDYYLGRGEEG